MRTDGLRYGAMEVLIGELTTRGVGSLFVTGAVDQSQVCRLLDLLNAQNTYYSVQVLEETARSAVSFAEYRIVSADGRLLATLNQTPPVESDAIARVNATVPPKPDYDTIERKAPPPLDGAGRGYFGKL
jgi:hypothetical protein